MICALLGICFSICLHHLADNEFIGVRYGSGRHVILLKDPAALGKVRTPNRIFGEEPYLTVAAAALDRRGNMGIPRSRQQSSRYCTCTIAFSTCPGDSRLHVGQSASSSPHTVSCKVSLPPCSVCPSLQIGRSVSRIIASTPRLGRRSLLASMP